MFFYVNIFSLETEVFPLVSHVEKQTELSGGTILERVWKQGWYVCVAGLSELDLVPKVWERILE